MTLISDGQISLLMRFTQQYHTSVSAIARMSLKINTHQAKNRSRRAKMADYLQLFFLILWKTVPNS